MPSHGYGWTCLARLLAGSTRGGASSADAGGERFQQCGASAAPNVGRGRPDLTVEFVKADIDGDEAVAVGLVYRGTDEFTIDIDHMRPKHRETSTTFAAAQLQG